MAYLEIMNDIALIDSAKEYLKLNRHLCNTNAYQLMECLTYSLEKYVGPKPKQKSTWSQVWDKFDNYMRCEK